MTSTEEAEGRLGLATGLKPGAPGLEDAILNSDGHV
jgi:hypothetical protein